MLMKQDTLYWNAIIIEVWVSCTIYKLAHDVSFLICNKLFAINKSIVSFVFHEFVEATNFTFRKLVLWPIGEKMNVVMEGFWQLWGSPNVHNAIDGTHIQISKLKSIFPHDYYYHKIGDYLIITQVVVDSLKNKSHLCRLAM